MPNGSLVDQLRKYHSQLKRGDKNNLLSPQKLAKIVVDICNGMKEMENKKVSIDFLTISLNCFADFTLLYNCVLMF